MDRARSLEAAAALLAGVLAAIGLLACRRGELAATPGAELAAQLCEPDPHRLWHYRSGVRLAHETPEFSVRVRTNGWGLRGWRTPSPPQLEDPAANRVLVIGGTNTFGWGVPERVRFSEILARRLSSEFAPLTVLNAGHWGYALDQQLVLLRELLPRVRPTLVIHAVPLQAVALLTEPTRGQGNPDVVRVAQSRARTSEPAGPVPATVWPVAQALLEEVRADVDRAGSRYVVAVLPEPPDSRRAWSQDFVDALRARPRTTLVDLRPAFAGASTEQLYYPGAGSWTRAGHSTAESALEGPVRAELEAAKYERAREELPDIRRFVTSLEPGLGSEGTRLETALALRDFVHRRVPLQLAPPGFQFTPLFHAFRATVLDPGVGHICGGLALTYTVALEAFGIPARYVGLHAAAHTTADNHASVEFHDGKRWIASDPTFNVSFRRAGHRLGWEAVRQTLLDGGSIEVRSDGYEVAPGRRLNRYYVPLKRLVAHMVVYADVDGDGALAADELLTWPSSWDGSLASASGSPYQHTPPEVYRILGYHASR